MSGSDYAKAIKAKGWTQKNLAERWGITPRRLRQIAAQPTQRDWDALNGVESMDGKPTPGGQESR